MKAGWGRAAFMLLATVLMVSACTEYQTRPGDREPRRVTLCLPGDNGWMPLSAEIASTPEERSRGLTGRERLPRRAGMLFLYPEVQGPGNRFWMYQTNMPLTIAFMEADGTIRALQGMSPCQAEDSSQCRRFEAGVSHSAALEVNQGLFKALGVETGDRVALDPSSLGECRDRVPFSMEAVSGSY